MPNLLVRVWLPDRPGALGLVASRIGAIGGDIVGVDVLERSEHVAVDEFAVVLTGHDLVPLLVREIEEVDGASVEECREVERFPDPRLDALKAVQEVCAADDARDSRNASSRTPATSSRPTGRRSSVKTSASRPPGRACPTRRCSSRWRRELRRHRRSPPAMPDPMISVAPLPMHDAVLLVGRDGHPFRRRERRQLLALARVADRVLEILKD